MAIKHRIKFNTEVVKGLCPECHQDTVLVSVVPEFYRCSLCGSDLKQHINGKIVYLPHITRPKNADPFVKEWKES